jgi:hypothetical protein
MLAVFAATLAAGAHAETAECERHLLATYPFPHRPTAELAAVMKDCDADKFYYGIGVHFNYVKARHCAFAKDKHDVLMMLYANGLGVPRNYVVAKMAACRTDATPAETEARLARLARMQGGREGPSPSIDLCDDASSDVLLARCAANRAALDEQALDEQLEQLTTRWSSAEQDAILLVWRHARLFGKTDAIKSLQEFEAGKLPIFSLEDLARAERELHGQMPASWQAYRDAWLAFGKLRYPSVAPHAWKTYFTRKRAAQLKPQP